MKKWFIMVVLGLFCTWSVAAQEPLYVVNGTRMTAAEFHRINPELIEGVETLPADEESIEKYGPEAGNGVIIITLKNDTPARFLHPDFADFERWLIDQIGWRDNDPTARIAIRFEITAEGLVGLCEVLEATDKRLERRTLKALQSSPRWQPALRMGVATSSQEVINLTLPEGRRMATERYIILR